MSNAQKMRNEDLVIAGRTLHALMCKREKLWKDIAPSAKLFWIRRARLYLRLLRDDSIIQLNTTLITPASKEVKEWHGNIHKLVTQN